MDTFGNIGCEYIVNKCCAWPTVVLSLKVHSVTVPVSKMQSNVIRSVKVHTHLDISFSASLVLGFMD